MAHHAIQPVPLTRAQRYGAIVVIALLALAASWPGVYSDFTYDDRFIVLANTSLHDIHNWWRYFISAYWPAEFGNDGYRPLTILSYSLQWAAAGGKPWIFHATNIGLYMIASVAVFFLAETCLPFAAAWVAAALYAVHPVHVEAVGNVVGQSELLVAVFLLSATTFYVRRRNANELTPWAMVGIAALYAAACLSKEHGFVLPFVLLAAELTVVVDRTPLKARVGSLRPLALGMALVAVAYSFAHLRVNEELTGFHPYIPFERLGLGFSGRFFTMAGLVPEWFRLFLWPIHLSSEYGPPQYPVVNGFELYQLPGMIGLFGVIALGLATWKRAPAVSFGIWFMILTLLPTSNFLIPTGLLLAERTLLTPTAGVMIAVSAIVPVIYLRTRTPAIRLGAAAALVAALLALAWRSSERTRIWKDNEALFTATVEDAPFVYRAHFMLGAWRMSQLRKVQGEREYLLAMSMYDSDPLLYYSLGEEYRGFRMYHRAIAMYNKALAIDTTMYEARARLAIALAGLGQWKDASREAIRALSENTRSTKAMLQVVRLAGAAGRRAAGQPPPSLEEAERELKQSGKPPVAVQKATFPNATETGTKGKPPGL